MASKPLKEFDAKLAPYGFLRTHQSHLINTRYIRSFNKRQMLLLLEDGQQALVSQNKKASLTEFLDNL